MTNPPRRTPLEPRAGFWSGIAELAAFWWSGFRAFIAFLNPAHRRFGDEPGAPEKEDD
jgi:hypothetical protein